MSLGIVNPKKRREIEGVSSTSLIDLKATLFSAEENVKRAKADGIPASRGRLNMKAPVVRNKGIEERMMRDQLEEDKCLDPSETLGVKTQHYQHMAQKAYRDQGERFLVDFERKAWESSRQGYDESQPDVLSLVMAPGLRGVGEGDQTGEQHDVLMQLGKARENDPQSAEALKAKRLAAAKKRIQQKKQL